METTDQNYELSEEEIRLIESQARQNGLNAADLLGNTDLSRDIDQHKSNRQLRRQNMLNLFPNDPDLPKELDTTDRMAFSNLVEYFIPIYRKRLTLLQSADRLVA